MTELLDHLRTRRSALSLTLEEPGPDAEQLKDILTIAARVPDHGKLAPWRFENWTPDYRERLHRSLHDLLESRPDVPDRDKLKKGTDKLLHGPCAIAVISTPAEHPKIPVWEQILSAGAVCLNMLHAANAHGFEAQWLTGWYIYDDEGRGLLKLKDNERVAGLIHIGTSSAAKSDRDRPDIDAITTIREG